MADLPRIGRKAMPGEATMQLVREKPEVLDQMAWCMWADVTEKGHTMQARAEWDAMSGQDRQAWIDRAFAAITEDSAKYDAEHPPRPDDDPNGGLPLPIARTA